MPALDNTTNPVRICKGANLIEWVHIRDHEVGQLAGFQCSEVLLQAQQLPERSVERAAPSADQNRSEGEREDPLVMYPEFRGVVIFDFRLRVDV